MSNAPTKRSYTVPCDSAFRDRVLALADRRRVNAADLARSVVLTVPEAELLAYPDPGDPPKGDRETVVLKSGRQAGRPWRRKPRLQVRLQEGLTPELIRRALALALDLDSGKRTLRVVDAGGRTLEQADEELERLRAIVSVLSFEPLAEGVRSRPEALHVMGFLPTAYPTRAEVRNRFRQLATVHHPDSVHGNHQRMAQLNAALELLTHR